MKQEKYVKELISGYYPELEGELEGEKIELTEGWFNSVLSISPPLSKGGCYRYVKKPIITDENEVRSHNDWRVLYKNGTALKGAIAHELSHIVRESAPHIGEYVWSCLDKIIPVMGIDYIRHEFAMDEDVVRRGLVKELLEFSRISKDPYHGYSVDTLEKVLASKSQ